MQIFQCPFYYTAHSLLDSEATFVRVSFRKLQDNTMCVCLFSGDLCMLCEENKSLLKYRALQS